MSKFPGFDPDDKWIVSNRGSKNRVDPFVPYDFLIEKERTSAGRIEDVAVIFLTGRECPFHCLMCDLWKNTTDKHIPGAVHEQIRHALESLPSARHVKLYNSGSFFDKRAIAAEEYERIASLLEGFDTVIVESHPAFIRENCLQFRNLLKGRLEVAIGLETVHPEILPRLNKRMTIKSFREAVSFLAGNEIGTRAFILLKPPFLNEEEGVFWAQKTIDFAFDSGVECCTVIPVRPGNGSMDRLMETGYFSMPSICSLEKVLEYGINLGRGRVFADTWNLKLFSICSECLEQRTFRLVEMNLSQAVLPEISCRCLSAQTRN